MEFDNIAEVIYYWLNYHNTVSRSKVLIESSIRYPFTEYLERRLGADVFLEVSHPVFKGLHYDFMYKIGEKQRNIELKYLHDYSDRVTEFKRYFDDLVRLAVLPGANFFILCGDRYLYENKIKKEYTPIMRGEKGNIPVEGESDKRFTSNPTKVNDFSRLLPLEIINNPVSFCPLEFWPYVGGKDNEDKENRQIPIGLKGITTKLIAKLDDENKGSQVVYIWQVETLVSKKI